VLLGQEAWLNGRPVFQSIYRTEGTKNIKGNMISIIIRVTPWSLFFTYRKVSVAYISVTWGTNYCSGRWYILYIQRLPQPLPNSGCYWPCRNPCLFDVELATQSLSLFLTNQINRNLVHLKRL
jgi:hypothetical protein